MKNDEKRPSNIGILRMPNYKGEAGNKVIELFTKLKRKAEQVEPSSVTPLRDIEPNMQELGYSAMNSYRIGPEVIKTDGGFEVV